MGDDHLDFLSKGLRHLYEVYGLNSKKIQIMIKLLFSGGGVCSGGNLYLIMLLVLKTELSLSEYKYPKM